jgi:choline kinase
MQKISIVIPNAEEKNIELLKVECRILFPDAQIIIGNDIQRQGKGYTIKKHIYETNCKDIIFLDGDMDIHPRMINRLLPFLEDYHIVVGSKGIGKLPFRRKVITLLSRIYIKLMFNLDVDTQTGIKAFRRYCIPEWESKGFMFDVELLAKAKRRGLKMVEVPVEVKIAKQKSIGVLWKALIDSLKVWYQLLSR